MIATFVYLTLAHVDRYDFGVGAVSEGVEDQIQL